MLIRSIVGFFCLLIIPTTIFADSAGGVFFITTPSVCSELEKIEGSKIYLTMPDLCSSQGHGKVQVAAEASIESFEIYVNGEFIETQKPETYNVSGVMSTVEQAESFRGDNLEKAFEQNPYITQGVEAAENTVKDFNKPEYQKLLADEKERVTKEFFSDQVEKYYPEMEIEKEIGKLGDDERIYLFFSSSMPELTLRTYAEMIANAKDERISMVLRGFIGGPEKIVPTMEFIGRITMVDRNCDLMSKQCELLPVNVIIDPLLFDRYAISEVPALVFAQGVSVVPGFQGSEGNGEMVPNEKAFKIYGDASLTYLLEKVNSKAKAPVIPKVIAALNGNFYNQK